MTTAGEVRGSPGKRRAGPSARLRPEGREGRSGAVLVVVVLLVVAVFALGHGLVVATRLELQAARAASQQLEARAVAEGAVELAVRAGGGAWMDTVTLWSGGAARTGEVGEVTWRSLVRRLGTESWLFEATAEHAAGPAAGSAQMAWVLDPWERVRDLPGVVGVGVDADVTVDGVIETGAVDGGVASDPWLSCPAPRPPTTPRPPVAWSATHTLPAGPATPALGELSFAELTEGVPPLSVAAGTPGPVERLGACVVEDPWNWGDPSGSERPCGAFRPARFARGGLAVEGGEGQGVLLVDGDLAFGSGARYYGLVIVTGRLVLGEGAVVEGFALALGGLSVDADARLAASPCPAVAALVANRRLFERALVRREPVGPW